jgi:endothelin-converting enzyme
MAPYNTYELANLCTTPACIRLAWEILWGIAPNYTEVDPCTEFGQCKY